MLHFFVLAAASLGASEWTTSDGQASVRIPDETRFVQIEAPPPLAALWISRDESIKLGIAEIPMPDGMTLRQSSVEEGLAEEMGGRIVDSSVTRQGEHAVFMMTAHSDSNGVDLYITQGVVAANGRAYKVMAVGIDSDPRTDADAAKFIASFELANAAPATGSNRAVEPIASIAEDSQLSHFDLWSRRIGGISALVLIVGVIVLVLRGCARRGSS